MVHDDDKLALDTQVLNAHITTLQAEVEAKIRRVHRFRQQMQDLDPRLAQKNVAQRERAARALIIQVEEMLRTNLLVRDLLHDLRTAANAVLDDLLEP